MGHYVENLGDEPLVFLEIFKDDHYADVSLNQWLAMLPEKFVQQHLDLGKDFTDILSKEKHPVVKRNAEEDTHRLAEFRLCKSPLCEKELNR